MPAKNIVELLTCVFVEALTVHITVTEPHNSSLVVSQCHKLRRGLFLEIFSHFQMFGQAIHSLKAGICLLEISYSLEW